jgi:hypothetical protein
MSRSPKPIDLEAKARGLAGLKGYTTNLTEQTPEFVIDAYHQLWRIQRSFRMSKHDLQATPAEWLARNSEHSNARENH